METTTRRVHGKRWRKSGLGVLVGDVSIYCGCGNHIVQPIVNGLGEVEQRIKCGCGQRYSVRPAVYVQESIPIDVITMRKADAEYLTAMSARYETPLLTRLQMAI